MPRNPKHYPGRAKVVKPEHGQPTHYLCVQLGDGNGSTTLEMEPADARRLAACWNACIGINPKCVPQLLEFAEECANDSKGRVNQGIKDYARAVIQREATQ